MLVEGFFLSCIFMQLHHVKHNYIIVYVNMPQWLLFEVLQILDFRISLYANFYEFYHVPFSELVCICEISMLWRSSLAFNSALSVKTNSCNLSHHFLHFVDRRIMSATNAGGYCNAKDDMREDYSQTKCCITTCSFMKCQDIFSHEILSLHANYSRANYE